MRYNRLFTIMAGACVVYALALYFDLHPFLRGGFGWRWDHDPAPVYRTVLLATLLTGYIAGAYALLRWTERGLYAVLWAIAGSVTLALAVIYVKHGQIGYELFVRTVSMVSTGPHHAAAHLDLNADTLRNWTELARTFDPENELISRHVIQAPPGLPMLHEGANTLFAAMPGVARLLHLAVLPYQCNNYALLNYTPAEWASAWVGMLMPLWAALTALPLYAVARRLGLPPRQAVLWWPLVLMPAAFAGSWNTVYPLLTMIAFYLYAVGLEHHWPQRAAWVLGAGCICGVLTFLNFAPVPVVMVFGFYGILLAGESVQVVGRARFDKRGMVRYLTFAGLRRAVVIGLWYTLGLALPWLAWLAFGGETPLEILVASFDVHLELERPYLPWVFLHVYDWALFAGVPLVIASVPLLRHPHPAAQRLAWALWLSVIVLTVSGVARAETARVWSFFTPFALLAAVSFVVANRRLWVVLSAATAGLFLAIAPTWQVFDAASQPARPEPIRYVLPMFSSTRIDFDGRMVLTEWDIINYIQDNRVLIWFQWEATQPMTTPYWFSALLVGPDGAPVGESVIWQGQQTHYPTTCWQVGEGVIDNVTLTIPQNAEPGDYWLSLAAFADEAAPMERLPVTLPDGTQDTQVGLGPIPLP
jgi:hypothetical protein